MSRGRQAAAIGLMSLTMTGGLALPGPSTLADQSTATPAATECTVAPLSGPIWDGVEIAEPTAPVSVAGPFVPPSGSSVDDATMAGISATVAESIACQNAGDVRRTLALFSPDAVRGFFSGPRGFDPESVEATASADPVPVSDDRIIELVSIEDMVLLADGRVGATVTTAVGELRYVDALTFIEGSAPDGTVRWLIDSSIAIDGQTQVEGGATEIP